MGLPLALLAALACGPTPPRSKSPAVVPSQPAIVDAASVVSTEPQASPHPPAPTEIEEAALTYTPELPRVRLQKRTRPRFSLFGAPLPGRAEGPWPLGPADVYLLEKREGALRIATHTMGGVVLLLWVQDELEPLLTMTVRLQTSATPDATGRSYVELGPGVAVAELERTDDAVRIEARLGDSSRPMALAGWVPPDAIGTAYEERGFPYELSAMNVQIEPGTPLRSAPAGEALFELVAVEETNDTFLDYYEAKSLGRRGAWRLVEYTEFCPGRVRVRGWVSTRRARQVEPVGGGGGCGPARGGDRRDLESPEVPLAPIAKGTLLRSSPGGPIVGRVLSDIELPTVEDGTRLVPTMWGLLPVAADEDVTSSR